MKERIRKLLASGLRASEIATIVGCSPGYVSQLLSDEEFKKAVQEEAIQNAASKTEDEHLDTRYQNLEHKILNNIEQALPNAELPQLTRALEVVAKRQNDRKVAKLPVPASIAGNVNIHVTQIALPQHVLEAPKPIISVNEQNEIVAIDARPLAPMSSAGVKNIFQQIKEAKVISQQVLQEI